MESSKNLESVPRVVTELVATSTGSTERVLCVQVSVGYICVFDYFIECGGRGAEYGGCGIVQGYAQVEDKRIG
jgi:hypothetical protein